MPLPAGSRLGSYEILALLGSGGMGEVYRARDTKLNREVALKILPSAFAADPERLARFTREAQTLAALNHPHIAHIHGLEDTQGVRALVMELVDGEDLSARIGRGALPLDEALPIARQIADALEAAHEKGIIHRDLKPANIMLAADGQVKVLDFGLAKALDPTAGSDIANSPTLTFHATQAGIILGTAAYMSPEQAKGRAVDKRSDIWAFGCVLYEMLTARRAFEGEDATDTIAAVVRGEPDWSALPADVPGQIRLLLKRCLEKDRRTRVSDIAVARFLMTETISPNAPAALSSEPGPVRWSSRRRAIVAGIGLVAGVGLLAIAAWVGTKLTPISTPQTARFAIVTPPAQPLSIQSTDRNIAISPDGAHIVYRSGVYGIGAGAESQLAVRPLNEVEARPLPDTGGRGPFMSPDGRWIGFFATGGEIKKVSISGGPSVVIAKYVVGPGRGASWSPDGTIVYSTSAPGTGLFSVPESGGEPKILTTPDPAKGETGHQFPFVLPGRQAVLFTISGGQAENAQVAVLDLKTGQRKTLIHGGSDATYAETGHLVYAVGTTLLAVRFNLARLEVIGESIPVVEKVVTSTNGRANYALSRQGTLAYLPFGAWAQAGLQRSLVWVTRQGREEPLRAPARPYAVARLAPDGTRIALDVRDQTNDIWIWDIARQTLTPLNLHPLQDMSPVWTPDGRRVIWTSSRAGGTPNLYWQAADGTGVIERLTTSVYAQFPSSVTPDGTRVAMFGVTGTGAGSTAEDISLLALAGEQRSSEALIHSPAAERGGEISPDGHWIAYQSDESSQFQVYVRPFPNVDSGRWQISPSGGTRPAWARNGRELFYLDGDDKLTSVPVQATATTFSAGNPVKILDTRYYPGLSSRGIDLRGYDISPDGQRFLMIKDPAPSDQKSTATPASIIVVLNWFEELKARLPPK